MLGREKIMIHCNLSLALLLGQIVFVSSSDAYKDPVNSLELVSFFKRRLKHLSNTLNVIYIV